MVDQYYVTLDGFGQRYIHQVVLDPCLHMSNSPSEHTKPAQANQFLSQLSIGSLHALLDLFVHEEGPRIRAVFSHGMVCLLPILSCTH